MYTLDYYEKEHAMLLREDGTHIAILYHIDTVRRITLDDRVIISEGAKKYMRVPEPPFSVANP